MLRIGPRRNLLLAGLRLARVEAAEPPALRLRACCGSEPECPLCPLLPQNAHRSLRDLQVMGLRANLHEVGLA